MKKIVTIQDISCFGKCSLTVALPIISAMGVEAAIIPTAVLSTHTMFKRFTFKDLSDQIAPISEHWQEEGLKFDALYTGYLGSFEQIDMMKQFFADFGEGALKFVDPAMGDNGKLYPAFDEAFAKMTCEEAIAAFNKYDIAVGPYYKGDFCLTDEQAEVNNYLMTVTEHMSGKEIKIPRFPVQCGEHPEFEDQPFSTLGGNTVEIMKQYGYTDDQIEAMAARGAIVVDK